MATGDKRAAPLVSPRLPKTCPGAPGDSPAPLCSAQPLPSASCQALLTHLILQPAQRRSFVAVTANHRTGDPSPARASEHRLQLHGAQKGP